MRAEGYGRHISETPTSSAGRAPGTVCLQPPRRLVEDRVLLTEMRCSRVSRTTVDLTTSLSKLAATGSSLR